MTEGSLQREAATARRRLGRVLVTGANGFIGAALVDRLRRDGEEVVASDLTRGDAASADFQGCDITDPRQVETLFARGPFDTTFHGGAISGPMVMAGSPLDGVVKVTGFTDALDDTPARKRRPTREVRATPPMQSSVSACKPAG